MKRFGLWGAGFVVLFLINALVEIVFLPLLGLHNTEKNDIYFLCWWMVVAAWFVFGIPLLRALEKTHNQRHSLDSGQPKSVTP